MAPVAQNKVALREGLKIVRKVIARDGKTGLTTAEIFRLAIREPPPPTYGEAIQTVRETYSITDDAAPEATYGRAGRRRIPPPSPPNPRHPVRSISFLKHRILPIILGERYVQRFREKRLIEQSVEEVKPARGTKQPQPQQVQVMKPPIETVVYMWRATRPPARDVEKAVSAPQPAAFKAGDYDCSHMKASKRKARRLRDELAAKRAELDARRKALRTEARRKVEREVLTKKRAEGRALHEEAERAGLEAKERRRKEWEAKNPKLAREAARLREEFLKRLGRDTPPKQPVVASQKKLRA
ncbi:hypothetical protein FB451DRAFT_1393036 [Mycena latifolia]|nr:hypothetical protein FB451DRAFT_1393036 [Mycena latifolia]